MRQEVENVAILIAIAINEDGYREVLGAAEGMKENGIEETLTEYPLYVCNSGSILCLTNV